ncbi:MAG TPA: DinB family protein [Gemmatimonadales bacterium]
MARDQRIRLLLEVVEQAFRAPSWHGTPLWGSLRGITPREALWRPRADRHCIWEIALHTAYWKCMVRRRLLRDADISLPRAPSNWPRTPARPTAAGWHADRALLAAEHAQLIRAIAGLAPADLGRRGWRSKWSNVQHIYGIASHDLYHAGQIQLLKRLGRSGVGHSP